MYEGLEDTSPRKVARISGNDSSAELFSTQLISSSAAKNSSELIIGDGQDNDDDNDFEDY